MLEAWARAKIGSYPDRETWPTLPLRLKSGPLARPDPSLDKRKKIDARLLSQPTHTPVRVAHRKLIYICVRTSGGCMGQGLLKRPKRLDGKVVLVRDYF
jgi:hypothetical protein